MANRNPYYTEEQMGSVPPYLNQEQPYSNHQQQPYVNNQQQPYFSNQLQCNNPPQPHQYPPYHRQQVSPNILIVEEVQNRPPLNLTNCTYCRQLTPTYTQLRSGAFVWLMCLIIMMLTCCCWWIAFWIDSWKDIVFRCQRCGNVKAVKQGGF